MLKCAVSCINHLKTRPTTLLSNQFDLFTQQCRNTYILKRRNPCGLHKKNQRPRQLKHRHYIYDLVENTNARKPKEIEIILLSTMPGVGHRGQKLLVNFDKAYNNFLLPKLAVYATPENIEKYYIEDVRTTDEDVASSVYVQRTINLLSQCYLTIVMSLDRPWTIEKWHVRTSFRKAGYIVPEDTITLPDKPISGPDLTIQKKQFYVTVKINNQEEVKVRCFIHHYTSDINKIIPNKYELWDLPIAAIFPEDQPILESLPKHRLFKENKTNDDG